MTTYDAVMLDIETMSTHRSRALILSWCATEFSTSVVGPATACPLIGLSHHGFPSLRQQFALGRFADVSTATFWLKQGEEARKAWTDAPEKSVRNALEDLATFIHTREVWAHGIGFDISNVESLFEDAHLKSPWKYNNVWDERTVVRKMARVRAASDAMKDGLVLHRPEDDNKLAIVNLWEHFNASKED